MFQTHDTTPTEITNVNLRTEKHGDDGDVAALDINVRAVCTSEQCEPLLAMSNEEIQAMFWDGEAGKLRSERVDQIKIDSNVAWKDHHSVKIKGVSDKVHRVGKFKLSPVEAFRFEVHFQIQVSQPADDFILAAKTGFEERDVTVYLEYQADLVDGAEADAA